MDSRCYFNVERPNLLSEPASEADQLWQIGPFFVTLALAYVIGFLGFHWMVFGLVFWVFLNQYIHSAKEEERQYFRYWRNKKLTTRFWVRINFPYCKPVSSVTLFSGMESSFCCT